MGNPALFSRFVGSIGMGLAQVMVASVLRIRGE